MKTMLLTIILLLLTSTSLYAAEQSQEQYWEAVLKKDYKTPELITLKTNDTGFAALYRPSSSNKPQGAAIILHPAGKHPDWPVVISNLRFTLPKFGWTTLSIQLPVLDNNETLDQYAPLFKKSPARVQAAINYLQSKGNNNIVLIGYELGATMAADAIATLKINNVNALVGISMLSIDNAEPRMNIANSLERISLPILDIYASQDLRTVLDYAESRSMAVKKSANLAFSTQSLSTYKQSAQAQTNISSATGYISYRRFVITGANHDYSGFEDQMTRRILGWLKKHAGGIAAQTR